MFSPYLSPCAWYLQPWRKGHRTNVRRPGLVVTGRVERIVKTQDGENDNFIIHLRVETVGRGTEATVGELFSVSIWR